MPIEIPSLMIFTIRDYIIIALGIVIVFCIYEIFKLKRTILMKEQEIQRCLVPILKLKLDTYDAGIYIKNDSNAYAKDIFIKNITTILDYDFKKEITLTFDPIDHLDPSEKVKLNYRAFDKQYEITSEQSKKLIPRLERTSFELKVHYANIYNHKYEAIIMIDKGKTAFKKVIPADKA